MLTNGSTSLRQVYGLVIVLFKGNPGFIPGFFCYKEGLNRFFIDKNVNSKFCTVPL